jgi:nucleoside recognition membrane protein YjiH
VETILTKLNPAVPRHFLFALAGVLWACAGVVLCFRGVVWIEDVQFPVAFGIEFAGILLAALGYVFMFSRVVRKNIARIGALPERVCVFAFTAWRGYLIIAVMMTAGIALRNSAIPHFYLVLPYTTMGGMLLTGSAAFSRQFVVSVQSRRAPGT